MCLYTLCASTRYIRTKHSEVGSYEDGETDNNQCKGILGDICYNF